MRGHLEECVFFWPISLFSPCLGDSHKLWKMREEEYLCIILLCSTAPTGVAAWPWVQGTVLKHSVGLFDHCELHTVEKEASRHLSYLPCGIVLPPFLWNLFSKDRSISSLIPSNASCIRVHIQTSFRRGIALWRCPILPVDCNGGLGDGQSSSTLCSPHEVIHPSGFLFTLLISALCLTWCSEQAVTCNKPMHTL